MSTQPFTLLPDGAEPITERLEWLTAVETARNGTERRAPLRARPRYGLAASFVMPTRADPSALSPLSAGDEMFLPAWTHPLTRDAFGLFYADAIAPHGDARPFVFRLKNSQALALVIANVGVDGRVFADNADQLYGAGWPAVPARLTDDSFEVQCVTPTVRTFSLSFQSTDVIDAPPAWSGSTDAGLPLYPERHDWTNTIRDTLAFSANSFDAGHLTTWEKRYSTRTVSVLTTLTTREAVLAFRRFVYGLQGRNGAFRWRAPQDDQVRTWRLTSDQVELRYYRPGLARVELYFTEIE